MKKRIIAITVCMACMLAVGGMTVLKKDKENVLVVNAKEETVESTSTTVWKEVPIEKGRNQASAAYAQYDLKNQMQEADYVFSGTIVDCKEYEIEWTDEEGNLWGPYSKSVLEVKIGDEYYGESPVSGDSIKVYYPYSLSTEFDASVSLEERKEYVFITCALDEEFIEAKEAENSEDKFEQERYADVYVTSPVYDVLPIEEDNVLMYHDMFYWDEEVMQEVVTGEAIDSVEMDTMTSPDSLESGWFIALDKENFDEAFSELFQMVDYLPDAEELEEMHEGKAEKYSEEQKEEHKRKSKRDYWEKRKGNVNRHEKN